MYLFVETNWGAKSFSKTLRFGRKNVVGIFELENNWESILGIVEKNGRGYLFLIVISLRPLQSMHGSTLPARRLM